MALAVAQESLHAAHRRARRLQKAHLQAARHQVARLQGRVSKRTSNVINYES